MSVSSSANRIQVVCDCGKKYRCRPELLGKRFTCRACGNAVEAIAPETHAPEFVSTTSHCPQCGDELLPGMAFCLVCGHDCETGQNLLPEWSAAAQTQASSLSPYASATRTPRDSGTSRRQKKRNPSRDAEDETSAISWLPTMLLVVTAFTVLIVSYLIQAELNGRWFLGFYGALLVGCWGFSELIRDKSDKWLPFGISLATFLSVGAMRIYYGLHHEMAKYVLLLLMMFTGATLIAVGLEAVSGKKTAREIQIYVFVPGIALALTLFCLLWTFVGPAAIMICFIATVILLSIFGQRHRGHSSYGNCSSCSNNSSGGGGGGGGCGGGGCGGCGGGGD